MLVQRVSYKCIRAHEVSDAEYRSCSPEDKLLGNSRSQVQSASHGQNQHAVIGLACWHQPIKAFHMVIATDMLADRQPMKFS